MNVCTIDLLQVLDVPLALPRDAGYRSTEGNRRAEICVTGDCTSASSSGGTDEYVGNTVDLYVQKEPQ